MTSTDLLLQKHCPLYSTDYRENIFPISLEKYVETKQCVADNSVVAHLVEKPNDLKHLHYFLYFAADGGMEFFDIAFDGHQYDIEHMVVEVNGNDTVTGVLYQPHGSKEHFWIRDPKDLTKILSGGTQPIVYVSRGKHACYPLSDTIFRYFGVASDECEHPVEHNYTAVQASTMLLNTDRIDGVFPGISTRLTVANENKPVVKLTDVGTRLLFRKFW
jgi:hypothetical protein